MKKYKYDGPNKVDVEEYQPTGAEIDDHKLLYGTDSVMGPWTAACWLWVIAAIIFLAGFVLGVFVGKGIFC